MISSRNSSARGRASGSPGLDSEAVQAEANWGRRLLIGGGIALAIVVAVLIASAAVPRWWAQHIGDRVDGSITQGVFVGMFYGFVFTFLALLVFMLVMRRGRTVKVIAIGLGAALLLALPNLLTLGIVLGVGNGRTPGTGSWTSRLRVSRGDTRRSDRRGPPRRVHLVPARVARQRARGSQTRREQAR